MSEVEDVCPCCGEPVTMEPTSAQWDRANAIARGNPEVRFLVSGADHEDDDLWMTGDDGNELHVAPDGSISGSRKTRRAWGLPNAIDPEVRARALGDRP